MLENKGSLTDRILEQSTPETQERPYNTVWAKVIHSALDRANTEATKVREQFSRDTDRIEGAIEKIPEWLTERYTPGLHPEAENPFFVMRRIQELRAQLATHNEQMREISKEDTPPAPGLLRNIERKKEELNLYRECLSDIVKGKWVAQKDRNLIAFALLHLYGDRTRAHQFYDPEIAWTFAYQLGRSFEREIPNADGERYAALIEQIPLPAFNAIKKSGESLEVLARVLKTRQILGQKISKVTTDRTALLQLRKLRKELREPFKTLVESCRMDSPLSTEKFAGEEEALEGLKKILSGYAHKTAASTLLFYSQALLYAANMEYEGEPLEKTAQRMSLLFPRKDPALQVVTLGIEALDRFEKRPLVNSEDKIAAARGMNFTATTIPQPEVRRIFYQRAYELLHTENDIISPEEYLAAAGLCAMHSEMRNPSRADFFGKEAARILRCLIQDLHVSPGELGYQRYEDLVRSTTPPEYHARIIREAERPFR